MICDRVSAALHQQLMPHKAVYPKQEPAEGLVGFKFRYVCPPSNPEVCWAIGLRPFREAPEAPLWMRWHKETGGRKGAALVEERLAAAGQVCSRDGGHCWIPLDVPVEVAAQVVVESLVEQTARLDTIARAVPAAASSA